MARRHSGRGHGPRRRLTALLIGLGLIALGGTVPLPLPSEGGSAGPRPEGSAAGGVVGEAWRAKALEREHRAGAERFARGHGISTDLATLIQSTASEVGIDPAIAFGLVSTESSFRRTAVSYAGAVGYTQVLPSTARWLVPGTQRGDLFDARTNLRIGFQYLHYLLDYYDGDVRLALTAYNRGPGTVDRLLRRGRDPGNGYADRVLRRAG